MQREYKNVIFTTHAIERMKLRRIDQEMVVGAIKQPEKHYLDHDGDTKFIRTFGDRPLHVVSSYLKDEKKWLVKSVWVRGEDDPQPLWKQILSAVLRAFGIGKHTRR
jgi:hypothetical protein